MPRRMVAMVAILAALTSVRGGCQLPLNPAPPEVAFVNNTNRVLHVAVEGLESDLVCGIEPQRRDLLTVDACLGTSLKVETTSRELVGMVVGPLCPDWTLMINEDGTIAHTEDDKH